MCDAHKDCYMCGLAKMTKIMLRTPFKCDTPHCGESGNWRLVAYGGEVKLQQTTDPNVWLLVRDDTKTGDAYDLRVGLDQFRIQNALQKLAQDRELAGVADYLSD